MEARASGAAAEPFIQAACEFIQAHATDGVSLAQVAAHVGMSRFHVQRRFKTAMGVSPKQFAEACRLAALKGGLRSGASVTDAIYDAGFGSGSRVYERVDTRLGMTPGQYRDGGRGLAITHVSVECPLGRMMIGATERGLCFVQFGDSDAELLDRLGREYPAARLEPMAEPCPEAFRRWMDALAAHVQGQPPREDLPLDVRATAFQMRVWSYLQSIPRGSVRSYGEVAAAIGRPGAARAVAGACAANPVAMVIPCHRVIRGTGDLGGYRWGLARKHTLIEAERRAASATSPGGA